MRPTFAEDLFGTNDTCAIDQSVQAAKRCDSSLNGCFGSDFLTDIGDGKPCLGAQRLCLGLHGLGVEVHQHDLGPGFD
ncbi:hypothetical protein D3C77_639420 [compost metagenome]